MKAYRGSEALTPLILNLGAGWRWVVEVTIRPPPFPPSNPGTQWIGGWVSHRKTLNIFDKRKISCPFKDSNPVMLSRSLVRQLLYPGSFTGKGVKYQGADKSLARPGRKKLGSISGTRAISVTSRRALSTSFFSCKARCRRKFTPFCQKH